MEEDHLTQPPSEEHLVVTGLLHRHGRVLLVHRSPTRHWYPDTWDLPGGHVEVEESPLEALVRELGEELGILAEVTGEPLLALRVRAFGWTPG